MTYGCWDCGYDGKFIRALAPRPSRRRVRICPACLRVITRTNPPRETHVV